MKVLKKSVVAAKQRRDKLNIPSQNVLFFAKFDIRITLTNINDLGNIQRTTNVGRLGRRDFGQNQISVKVIRWNTPKSGVGQIVATGRDYGLYV